MAIGNTYYVEAPAHYAPYLLDDEAKGSVWDTAYFGARATRRNLASQGRVVTGFSHHMENAYWAVYKATEVA